ncbi:MAG: pirin family protein [Armatimonadetes bacterium]|nr:pirin family protein [Armatimonadota bacterium]
MVRIRRAAERGHAEHGWLDSWHTFSFADYHDPEHMGWRSLRVVNEDRVAAGMGFPTHGHRDMEIISYVVSGALRHRDSLDHEQVLSPNQVQVMSAGTGIMHSEFNASREATVHFLQIWLLPDRTGHTPRYEQRDWPESMRLNRLCLVASPDGADGSSLLHQEARVYASLLATGHRLEHALAPGRGVWLQLVRGEVAAQGVTLRAGDGLAVDGVPNVGIVAIADSEFILFDLGEESA